MSMPIVAISAVSAAILIYGALAWVACRVFGIVARASTAHLDLPPNYSGSHPFLPGGSPAGEREP